MAKQKLAERNWYAIHTYSGYENAVMRNLKQRVESLGMEDKIFNVIVPTETKIKVKGNKRVEDEEKIYPGYVLVDMIVTDDSWYVVRNTPRVTAGGTTANCSSSITVNDPIILPLSYTLTAIRNGQGTITSDVAGINCGSMCMGVYDEGTAVVLTATPAPRWRFIEWLGDCTAAGNTCTVQVDGPRTVTAKFRPNLVYEEL